MTETEIERLVVRLTGDSVDYQNMLRSAVAQTGIAAKQVEDAGQRIGAAHVAAGVMAADAIEGIANKVRGLAHEMIREYAAEETIEFRLTAAMQANGRQVQSTLEDYKQFALEMQRVTTVDDDMVLATLKVAETFDLTGETAKKAVADAYALAAANDSSADSMIRMTAAMSRGDVETAMGFARMIPQLRGVKDEMQFMEKYARLVAAGTRIAAGEMNTYAGAVKRMNVAIVHAKVAVGRFLAEALMPVIETIQVAAEAFQRLDQTIAGVLTTITLSIGGVLALGIGIKVLTGIVAFAASGLTAFKAVLFFLAANPYVAIAMGTIAVVAQVTGAFKKLFGMMEKVKADQEWKPGEIGSFRAGVNYEGLDASAQAALDSYIFTVREIERRVIEEGDNLSAEEFARLRKRYLGYQGMILDLQEKAVEAVAKQARVKKLRPEAEEFMAGLRTQYLTYGMDELEKAYYKVGEAMSWWDRLQYIALTRQLSYLKANTRATEELAEAAQEAADRAAEITKGVRTPQEVYKDTMKELEELFIGGFLDVEAFGRAGKKAFDEMDKAVEPVVERVEALNAGVNALKWGSAKSLADIERFIAESAPTGHQRRYSEWEAVPAMNRSLAVGAVAGMGGGGLATSLLQRIATATENFLRKEPIQLEPTGVE